MSQTKPMEIEDIARVAHEANRAYCLSLGDTSQPSWDEAPDWQKSSAFNGVVFHMDHPGALPSASHDSWLRQKLEEGWKWGPVKDPEAKLHPCCVPYDELPEEQRRKDFIFSAVVRACEMREDDSMHRLQWAANANARAKGWWDGVDGLKAAEALIPEKLCLIHSEVSEALEAYRDEDLWLRIDPATGKPEGVPAELADVIIRIYDLAAQCGWDISHAVVAKMKYNATRPHRHGGKRC